MQARFGFFTRELSAISSVRFKALERFSPFAEVVETQGVLRDSLGTSQEIVEGSTMLSVRVLQPSGGDLGSFDGLPQTKELCVCSGLFVSLRLGCCSSDEEHIWIVQCMRPSGTSKRA